MNNFNEKGRSRYSDEDLEEFKLMIEKKLEESRSQLEDLKEQLSDLNNSGDENRAGTFDDGASNWQREHINKLASRQQRFIRDLEHALIRIKNKTFGICSVTGKLIEKQRLVLVPHATKTVEGKTQNSNKSGKTTLTEIEVKPISVKNTVKEAIEEDFDVIDDYMKDFTEPSDDY